MKPNPSDAVLSADRKLLILSDGKPGHVNQAIAFARHLGFDYAVADVRFRNRLCKALSYLLDHCAVYSAFLWQADVPDGDYAAVVSAGSETYYANRSLARRLRCKSVAIMLPKGYRYSFDLIVAQNHDDPPKRGNLLSVPINLTWVEPGGLVTPAAGERIVSLIIGGNSGPRKLDADLLEGQLKKIFSLFPEHSFWLTTSRRTPEHIERMLRQFNFSRAVYYSQEPINPIPDFLAHSEYVFLTGDSTSMISEAVSFGRSSVEILPTAAEPSAGGKMKKFLDALEKHRCLHMFDGRVTEAATKIDLAAQLAGVSL